MHEAVLVRCYLAKQKTFGVRSHIGEIHYLIKLNFGGCEVDLARWVVLLSPHLIFVKTGRDRFSQGKLLVLVNRFGCMNHLCKSISLVSFLSRIK